MKINRLWSVCLWGLIALGAASCSQHDQNLYKLATERECIGCDLKGANLSNSNLSVGYQISVTNTPLSLAPKGLSDTKPVNLTKANLKDATFKHSNLYKATLAQANLQRANLQKTNLEAVNFEAADLREANLTGANLREANLYRAQLKGATLTDAIFCDTTMPDGSISRTNC